MFTIEFEHANVPAKIFFGSNFKKWATKVFFENLIQDQYEQIEAAASKAKRNNDVARLDYRIEKTKGKIILSKGMQVNRFIPHYTLAQRLKQAVKGKTVEEKAQELADKAQSLEVYHQRILYVHTGIQNGIKEFKDRIRARHFKMP